MSTSLDNRTLLSRVDTRSTARVRWRVYRHHLRLLRNSAVAWTAGLAGIGAAVVATFDDRYSTPAELEALAALEGIPAFEALVGRYVQVATVEGLVLSRWGMFGILVAIWGILAAVKLLRGAEESGHVEPVRSGAITPRGLLGAATSAMITVFALFAAVIGMSHAGAGMDVATAWALAAAMGLLGVSFAAIGALACQVMAVRSRAMALAGSVLGLTLGVRVLAAASATPEWLWWTTPFGWTGFLHEVDGMRPRVFSAFLFLAAAVMAAAFLLVRRDLHGGVIGSTEEAISSPPVRSVAGLYRRLTARSAATWGTVIVLLALVFGLIALDFAEASAAMPTTVELVARIGWGTIDTVEGILALTFTLFLSLLVGVFAAGQAAAIREEEASWRLEHLLVRPVGRARWLLVATSVSAGAVVVIALVAGLVAWLGTGITGASVGIGDALLAGLNVVPVGLLFLGIGVALFGLLPRLTASLTYGLVLGAYLLEFVGGFLDLPEAVLDLSPFRHLASVPVVGIDMASALVMLAVGLAGVALGLASFRRRDLTEA